MKTASSSMIYRIKEGSFVAYGTISPYADPTMRYCYMLIPGNVRSPSGTVCAIPCYERCSVSDHETISYRQGVSSRCPCYDKRSHARVLPMRESNAKLFVQYMIKFMSDRISILPAHLIQCFQIRRHYSFCVRLSQHWKLATSPSRYPAFHSIDLP